MTATGVGSLQGGARSLVEWLEDAAEAPSIGDWLLIALAGAALYWVWSSLRATTRIGPVEVSTVEHDATPKAHVLALTAALRERLHATGLSPPPAVPAGTPQVSLIAAVEASNIPQGAWLSKLLQLLPQPPRPPEYKVTAVLLTDVPQKTAEPAPEKESTREVKAVLLEEEEDAPPDTVVQDAVPRDTVSEQEAAKNANHRLSVWLRPSREGTVLLKTTFPASADTDAAVQAAARMIYLHIADNAPHAFPIWARWRHQHALEAYGAGCDLAGQGKSNDAVEKLMEACRREPFNVLAPLRLATMQEAAAAAYKEPWSRGQLQVVGLRAYLDTTREWPHLVEPRYRTSVLASALAATWTQMEKLVDDKKLKASEVKRLERTLALPRSPKRAVIEQLHDLAARESRAGLQLLQPWYVLIREQRLRNQFEPKGHQRRRLRHAVGISRHCVRVRNLRGRKGLGWRPVFWYHTLAVHVRHLLLGRGLLGGQAFYNAACFDALLLDHLRRLGRAGVDSKVGRRIQERSIRLLKEAYREAPDELPADWPRNDPDFEVFRQGAGADGKAWSAAVEQLELALRRRSEAEQQHPSDRLDLPSLQPPADHQLPFPTPPWGNPRKRIAAYLATAAFAAAAAVATAFGWLADPTTEVIVIMLVVIFVALLHADMARWEGRLTRDAEPGRARSGSRVIAGVTGQREPR